MNFVLEMLRLNSERIPENNAYVFKEKFITFKELYEKSLLYGKILRQQGTLPVIIKCDKSVESYLEIFSCIQSGRPYIPVDFLMPDERTEMIRLKCKSDLVLTPDSLKNIEIISGKNSINPIPEDKQIDENKIIYIISTSGSTGEPKEVPISYKNLFNFCKWISSVKYLKSYENKIVLNNSNFSFDLSVFSLFYSLMKGHTLISVDLGFDIADGFYDLNVFDSSIICATPSLLKLLLLNHEFDSNQCRNLKFIFSCGEILEPSVARNLFKRFSDVKIFNAYGPTEATCAVCGSFITLDMCEKDVLPMGDMGLSAVKIEFDKEEIILKGDSVFSGYLGECHKSSYSENGINCFKTCDLAFVKENQIYFKGRSDFQIKYSGYRIDLCDIELNLKAINGIKDAVVTAKRDEKGRVILLIAYVVSDLNEKEIRKELLKKIPKYMIPKKIEILDKIPVNKNGKIDRHYLETI
nr:AMP-binding protein [uncultured Treponema sp.]